MSFFQIAVNNLKRRKGKAAILFCGLTMGVAVVIGIYGIVTAMNYELQDRIDEFGANAVVLPRSEGIEINYGDTHVSDIVFDVESLREEDVPLIRTIPDANNLNLISPKLIGVVQAEKEENLLVVGINTNAEFSMKPWFRLMRQDDLSSGERREDLALLTLPEDSVILGVGVARVFQKEVGDRILLNGEEFIVYGVLEESGMEEDGLAFLNLSASQNLLGRPGELSMIEVNAYCRECPIEEITAQIQDVLPNSRVTALRQAALIREETIDRLTVFGMAFSGVILLVAGLVFLTTMLGAVKERTREIGIFRALGFRSSHIAGIIFLETTLISVASGLAGYAIGILLARAGGPVLAQMQVTIESRYDLILPVVLASVILGLVGSSYPAIKATRLNPAEALQFIE